jgi:hypothetical protein
MSMTISGSLGLFSLLHEALRHEELGAQICLSLGIHGCLDDFHWISNDLAAWPTGLYAIILQMHTHNS